MKDIENYFLIFLTLILLSHCSTKRIYIPTIKEQPRTGLNLNQPILVAILDSRTDKQEPEEVIKSLKNGLSKAYNKNLVWINYFDVIPKGRVGVRIRLNANEANFGSRIISVSNIENTFTTMTGQISNNWNSVVIDASGQQTTLGSTFSAEGWWIGTSWLELEIIDNRYSKVEKLSFPIVAEQKESNSWGYKSANDAVDKSWGIVSQHFIKILDSIFLALRDQKY